MPSATTRAVAAHRTTGREVNAGRRSPCAREAVTRAHTTPPALPPTRGTKRRRRPGCASCRRHLGRIRLQRYEPLTNEAFSGPGPLVDADSASPSPVPVTTADGDGERRQKQYDNRALRHPFHDRLPAAQRINREEDHR